MNSYNDPAFSRPTQITLEQVRAIRNNLLPLCERWEEFADRLEADGFSAFRYRQEFEESFCSTPEELSLNRRHAGEYSKILFSGSLRALLPFIDRETALNELYVSSHIEELLRNAPHVNRSDLTHAWSVCEPSNWKREELRLKHEQDHERRFTAMMRAEGAQFFREVDEHKSDASDQYGRRRLPSHPKLFIGLAEHYGERIGFTCDETKSHRNQPTVTRPINKDWDLRWSVGRRGYYTKSIFGPPRNEDRDGYAWFVPELFICGSNQPGQPSALEGEILKISYLYFVPNSWTAYHYFFDRYDLETCIKAHLTLIGYVVDDIVDAVRSALE